MTPQALLDLLDRFAQEPLAAGATPLHRLHRLEATLGRGPIYIKRDDLTGLGIGGNKVRNLEFLLGDATAYGADLVIASGQVQSNLCALTAAACARAGLDCILVHNSDMPYIENGNAMLNTLFGAERRYIGPVSESIREHHVQVLAHELRMQGRVPYVIKNGASTPMGCLGYVAAAAEMAIQIAQNRLSIQHVCVPGGNGGLAAGFIFGAALLGRPFHVELISVEHEVEPLGEIIEGFIAGLEALTGAVFPYPLDRVATLHGDYRCGGWGLIDPPVEDFLIAFARLEGILTEKVYTAKTLYGMVDLIKSRYFPERHGVCFLHSGGMGALFDQF